MCADDSMDSTGQATVDAGLARDGGISYIHLPAFDVQRAAGFYEAVFGWTIRNRDARDPSFDDGTGHVSGKFVSSLRVHRRPGPLLFIYVRDIETAILLLLAHEGEVVTAPYVTGTLLVAHFRDVEGNLLGLWQEREVRSVTAAAG